MWSSCWILVGKQRVTGHLDSSAIHQVPCHVLRSQNQPQSDYTRHTLCGENCAMQQLQEQLAQPFWAQAEWLLEGF